MPSDHDEALHPKRAWLNEQIRDGSVDTLVVALTDIEREFEEAAREVAPA